MDLVNLEGYKERNKQGIENFTRNRKMPFDKLVLCILGMVNESSQNALDRFFASMSEEDHTIIRQQSFSEARQNLKWEAFKEIFDVLAPKPYEKGPGTYQQWNGRLLLAVDGSKIHLPSDAKLREAFGEQNGHPMAQASILYDLLNKNVVAAELATVKAGDDERTLLLKHLDQLLGMNLGKAVILADRGYPSFRLIKTLRKKQLEFVFRGAKGFNQEIDALPYGDHTIKMRRPKWKKGVLEVRVVKFQLSSGEDEVLITNLMDKELTIPDFTWLYWQRWGIETEYAVLKNKLELENFSGRTELTVRQDFWAKMTIAEFIGAAYRDAQKGIDERMALKNNKYEYRVNINYSIGVLKDGLIKSLLEDDNKKRTKKFERMLAKIEKRVVPVRLNRSPPRIPKSFNPKGRFEHNRKSNC
jgi:hypothetical protein